MIIRKKKSLGQNFIYDKNFLKKISELIISSLSNTIIEVGPGPGTLTEYLFKKDYEKIILIEKDQRLIKNLNQKLDHVVVMDVPDNLIITRLSNRRSCKECGQVYNLIFEPPENAGKCNNCNEELYLREDDNPATIQQRLNVYHKQTEPVIKYYSNQGLTKIIDSKGTIDEIRFEILQIISS